MNKIIQRAHYGIITKRKHEHIRRILSNTIHSYSVVCKSNTQTQRNEIGIPSVQVSRWFSNDSNSNNNSNNNNNNSSDKKQPQTAEEYLSSLGYEDPQLQEGMKDALKMAFGKNITAANLKSLGMEGLKALSKSVIDQLKSSSKDTFIGKAHIKIPHHKFNFDLKIKENDTFLNAALEGDGKEILNEYLECVCGGNMSCSTCHIILDPISYSKLEKPCEAELDMLDLAYEPQETSRLGCQVKMTKELDGMIVTIPSGVNNLWS